MFFMLYFFSDSINFVCRILVLRKSKKWRQEELRYQLFVTDKTISSWKSNRTEPSLKFIVKLSELFHCSAWR